METAKKPLVTFFKRLLVILIFTVSIVFFCYSCSAISTVSKYKIDLKNYIGYVFEAENQQTVLVINSLEEAYINAAEEEIGGIYVLEQRDNVLFLEKGEGEEAINQVFISISAKELFWQTKNQYLYLTESD